MISVGWRKKCEVGNCVRVKLRERWICRERSSTGLRCLIIVYKNFELADKASWSNGARYEATS